MAPAWLVPSLQTLAQIAVAGAAGYSTMLFCLAAPRVQRAFIYLEWARLLWLFNPKNPSGHGFSDGQVTAFFITTPDGERLFAWHVLPKKVYLEHQNLLKGQPSQVLDGDFVKTNAFGLLKRSGTRLIINFHGNAGHVAQGYRPRQIHALLDADDDNTHILTFDYRGFGYSSGKPTEAGLIVDGVAAVDWAINVAGLEPNNILLQGHSLGTAVSTAVYEHFTANSVQLAGLILIAPFTDIPTLLDTFRMGGVVPILSPLRPFPALQKWFSAQVVDTWETSRRLVAIATSGKPFNIHLCHAKSDLEISHAHACALFRAVCAEQVSYNPDWPDGLEQSRKKLPSGRTVWETRHAPARGQSLRLTVFAQGYHNEITTFPEVASSSLSMFVAP